MRVAVRLFIALVLAAAAVAVSHYVPDEDHISGPIPVYGVIGQQLTVDRFTARVDRVELAQAIIQPKAGSDATPVTTHGVWMIVWVSVAATRVPVRISLLYPYLQSGPDQFTATDRLEDAAGTIDQLTLEPRIPRYGPIVFQLPPDRVAGAELVLGPNGGIFTTGRNEEIRVDLKISAAKAHELLAHVPAIVQLPPPVYE